MIFFNLYVIFDLLSKQCRLPIDTVPLRACISWKFDLRTGFRYEIE